MMLIKWLKEHWQALLNRRKLAREIDPEAFRMLASELRELARAAGRLLPEEPSCHERLKRIEEEMLELDRLTQKPEFRRLSTGRRIQLRSSLMQSREELLETVHTAPSPTSLLQ